MLELNKVMLVGNLTRDPEYRNTSTGLPVANLRIAVNRRRWDRESGEAQEDTLFIDVTAWRQLADFCNNYLQKGRRVFVEGSLKQDTWQDRETGANRSKILVVADRIQFADPKPADAGGSARGDWDGGENSGADQNGSPSQEGNAESSGNKRTEDDLPF
jgi:single-strand DNA-binding protein